MLRNTVPVSCVFLGANGIYSKIVTPRRSTPYPDKLHLIRDPPTYKLCIFPSNDSASNTIPSSKRYFDLSDLKSFNSERRRLEMELKFSKLDLEVGFEHEVHFQYFSNMFHEVVKINTNTIEEFDCPKQAPTNYNYDERRKQFHVLSCVEWKLPEWNDWMKHVRMQYRGDGRIMSLFDVLCLEEGENHNIFINYVSKGFTFSNLLGEITRFERKEQGVNPEIFPILNDYELREVLKQECQIVEENDGNFNTPYFLVLEKRINFLKDSLDSKEVSLKDVQEQLLTTHRFHWSVPDCRSHILSFLVFRKSFESWVKDKTVEFERFERSQLEHTIYAKCSWDDDDRPVLIDPDKWLKVLEEFNEREEIKIELLSFKVMIKKRQNDLKIKCRDMKERSKEQEIFDEKKKEIEKKVEQIDTYLSVLQRKVKMFKSKIEMFKKKTPPNTHGIKQIQKMIDSSSHKINQFLFEKLDLEIDLQARVSQVSQVSQGVGKVCPVHEFEELDEEIKDCVYVLKMDEYLGFLKDTGRRLYIEKLLQEKLVETCQKGMNEFGVQLVISIMDEYRVNRELPKLLKKVDRFLFPGSLRWGYLHVNFQLANFGAHLFSDSLVTLTNLAVAGDYDEIIAIECCVALMVDNMTTYIRLTKLAEEIVDVNVNYQYQFFSIKGKNWRLNCQEFAEKLIDNLNATNKFFPEVQRYLDEIREVLCNIKDQRSINLRYLTITNRFKMAFDKVFRLKEFKVGGENKLYFTSHRGLDKFFNYCQECDNDFELNYPGIYQLLKGFDRAFWNGMSKKMNHENLKPHENGCPFISQHGEILERGEICDDEEVEGEKKLKNYTIKEVVLESVKQDGDSLKYASEELKNDKEVVLEAVKQNGYSLKFVSEDLKNDKEVVLEAVKQNGYSLKYASEELKNDKKFVLEAVNQNRYCLDYAGSEELKSLIGLTMNIESGEDDIVQFLSERGKLGKEEFNFQQLVQYLTKRSEIYFKRREWNECIEDMIVLHQLASPPSPSEVPKKMKRVFGEILAFECENESRLKLHFQNILTAVQKQKVLIKDFSWMDREELKEDRVFVNEWKEKLFTEMKKSMIEHIQSECTASLSNHTNFLEISNEMIRSLSKKYIRCSFKYSEYISEETKKEVEKILESVVSPVRRFSSEMEEKTRWEMPVELLPDSPLNESRGLKGVKYLGFLDENSSRYGYGLEYGEFSGGGLFRGKKFRRLFYGSFNAKGLRHGEKCKEYSPRDGSLIFEGSFKNGKKEGKGIELSSDNVEKRSLHRIQVFEGVYRNGLRHGRGESYDPVNGEVVRGIWMNGDLDKSSVFKFECPIFRYSDVQRHLNNDQKVGKGAFGVIYKVKSSIFKGITKKEKFVAVKILDKSSTSMEQTVKVRMIRRGIGYCYGLKSKHILECYGIIIGGGEIGYVMKLCEKSIDKVIEEGKTKTIEIEEKIRILKETALGMKALHHQYLIHRDLKWGNVLLDFDGVVKITDFDTVKEDELQFRLNTMAQSSRIGTPGFRPPEVIIGKKYTLKCDVYAFGLMIYSLLFEKNIPYITQFQCSCGRKMTEILRNDNLEYHISRCNLRPLLNSDELKKYPSFLIELMVQCWEKHPFNRPSFEDILLRFSLQEKKKVYRISFQFPGYPGIQDQMMFLFRPFGIERIVEWIEKKFEKPFEEGSTERRMSDMEEEDDEETEGEVEKPKKKKTKVLLLEHGILGTVHSDEDIEKIVEKEEYPCLKVSLNYIDESYVIDPMDLTRRITLEEYNEKEKENILLKEENKMIRREKMKLMKDVREKQKKQMELMETVKKLEMENKTREMREIELMEMVKKLEKEKEEKQHSGGTTK